MNDVVGQMSLLDFYKEETKEAPVLLKPGQIINIYIYKEKMLGIAKIPS